MIRPVSTRKKTVTNRKLTALGSDAQNWRISRAKGLQILKAKTLEKFDWLVHGFSTRSGGGSILENSAKRPQRPEKVLNLGFTDWDSRGRVEANRLQFMDALGAKSCALVTLRQIHSDIVHLADPTRSDPPGGDALISKESGVLLAVQTADCIPILLLDPRRRAFASVHAGWRGTLARIAAKAVGKMQMEFGTNPGDQIAALGPGIHSCCYEVGPDVVSEFAAQFPQAREWFDGPFDQMTSGEAPNPLPWLSMMPPGHEPPPPRCKLDLYAANAAILVSAGLRPKNIFCSGLCTACRTDLLFSYRREGRTGRMMSVIGIR